MHKLYFYNELISFHDLTGAAGEIKHKTIALIKDVQHWNMITIWHKSRNGLRLDLITLETLNTSHYRPPSDTLFIKNY